VQRKGEIPTLKKKKGGGNHKKKKNSREDRLAIRGLCTGKRLRSGRRGSPLQEGGRVPDRKGAYGKKFFRKKKKEGGACQEERYKEERKNDSIRRRVRCSEHKTALLGSKVFEGILSRRRGKNSLRRRKRKRFVTGKRRGNVEKRKLIRKRGSGKVGYGGESEGEPPYLRRKRRKDMSTEKKRVG